MKKQTNNYITIIIIIILNIFHLNDKNNHN